MLKKKDRKALVKAQEKVGEAMRALNTIYIYDDDPCVALLHDVSCSLENAFNELDDICDHGQCFGCKYYKGEERA